MSFLDSIGSVFGGLLGQPDVPAVKVTAAESKVQAYDPTYPRQLCLGKSAWSTSVGWSRVHDFSDGTANPKEALTQILCVGDHEMGALTGILLGDKTYTVGTSTGSGGDDFIPATDDPTGNWDSTIVSADWYIPNRARSKVRHLWRLDGGINRHVLAFQWFDGTQTTELRDDDWLDHISGWDSHERRFEGIACVAIVWRVGINEAAFSGQPPRFMPICEGDQRVKDWGADSTTYSDNALDCFTQWLKWEYGPFQTVDDNWDDVGIKNGDFDATIMAAESDVGDESVADGDRYICSYQIPSGANAQEVYDTFDFLCGGLRVWLRPNGLWAARVGGPRTAVAKFNLDDLTGGVANNIEARKHNPEETQYNTVVVSYLSEKNLYEAMETDKSDSSYRTADGGVRLFETIENRGRHGKDSNQRCGLIKLDRHRLPEAPAFDCWHRFGEDMSGNLGAATRIEPGDIAQLTYTCRGWIDKEFELVQKIFDPSSFNYRLEFREWGSIRWDGEGDTPEEVGDDIGTWDGRLEPPTGLSVSTLNQPGTVQPDGSIAATVLIDVDDHPEDAIVGFQGGYSFRWQIKDSGDKKTTLTSEESRAITQLLVGSTYSIEARVEGRGVKSEWTSPSDFLITHQFGRLPTPVAGTGQGENLVADPFFEQSAGLTVSPFWDGDRNSAQTGGSVVFSATGGLLTPHCLIITAGGSGDTDSDRDVVQRIPYPVEPGQLFRVRTRLVTDSDAFTAPEAVVKLQFRDPSQAFLISADQDVFRGVYDSSVWKPVDAVAQVPHGGFVPLDGGSEAEVDDTGQTTTVNFPTIAPLGTNRLLWCYTAHNAVVTDENDPTGESGESWFFDARVTTTDGDDASILAYEGPAPFGTTITGGEVTQDAGDRWVLIGGALAGPNAGAVPSSAATGASASETNTATDLQVPYPAGITTDDKDDIVHAIIAVHADSGQAVVAPTDWVLVESKITDDMGLFVFASILAGTESGNQAFDWDGTGGNPVVFGFMRQYTGVLSNAVFGEVLLSSQYDSVNDESPAFRFDGVLVNAVSRFPKIEFSDFAADDNTAYSNGVLGVTDWFYPPPDGQQVELEFRGKMEVTGINSGTPSRTRVELQIRRERESDNTFTTLEDDIKVWAGKLAETEDEVVSHVQDIEDVLTPGIGGAPENDRFRYEFRSRVKDGGEVNHEWRGMKVKRRFEVI